MGAHKMPARDSKTKGYIAIYLLDDKTKEVGRDMYGAGLEPHRRSCGPARMGPARCAGMIRLKSQLLQMSSIHVATSSGTWPQVRVQF